MNYLTGDAESECRLCLGENSRILLFNTAIASQYRQKINICTGLEILENDELPSSICERCSLELSLAYNFVVRCKDTYKKLRVKYEKSAEKVIISPDIAIKDCPSEDSPNDLENLNNNEYNGNVKIDVIRKCKNQEIFVEYEMADETFYFLKTQEHTQNKEHGKKMQAKSNCNVKKSKYDQSSKTALQCSTCGLVAASVKALEIHSRTHTGERPHYCPQCGKSFAIKGTLKEHIYRLHTGAEKTCTCESCGKQFVREKDLNIHNRIHTGERPYQCPYCHLSFTQHGTVVRHIRTHTGEKPFACNVCGKHFAGQSVRSSHMRSHSDERPYQCSTCEKHFKSKSTLIKHQKLHAGLKDNICDQCGAVFATKGNLVVHIKKVHSEMSGVCLVCNKHFSNLKNHLPAHSGVAPYQCNVCSRRFLRKCSLAIHSKKHLDIGKFQCQVEGCWKIFTMKNMLNFHNVKYHTKNKPLICIHCSKDFSTVYDLTTHVKIHKLDQLVQVPIVDNSC